MEACRIPVDVCEAIMDEVSTDTVTLPETTGPPVAEAHRTLRACALTCRAWWVRAQFLLWVCACLDKRRLALFTVALRTAPKPLITSRLWLEDCTFVSSAELFMHTFPDLRQVTFRSVDFTHGPPLSMFRMRLPFFASITVLQFVHCRFRSWRAMMDVVWAFPNLTSLRLSPYVPLELSPAAGGLVDLSAICRYLRACQKLTNVRLVLPERASPPPSFTGTVFGNAVTELTVVLYGSKQVNFSRFCTQNSFPSLRSIVVVILHFKGIVPDKPYLHVIAASQTVPGTLKKIVIQCDHEEMNGKCCEAVVGTSEEVAGSPQRLPALLSGLEELIIRFYQHKEPGLCAGYIHSVLRSMGDVLRFEHFSAESANTWNEYL